MFVMSLKLMTGKLVVILLVVQGNISRQSIISNNLEQVHCGLI